MASHLHRISQQEEQGKEEALAAFGENVGSGLNGYDPKSVDLDLELITPEKAKAYLETSGPNRILSKDIAAKYARDIAAERWMIGTQGIGFDTSGRLIDGQHRMRAVILAGKAVYMPVFRNLHPEAIRTIDDNRKRTFSDDLKIEGRARYTKMASSAAMILRLQRGLELKLKVSTASKMPFSRVELRSELARLEAEGDMESAVLAGSQVRNSTGAPESAATAIHYLAVLVYGEEFTDAFFDSLKSGANLAAGDPTLALREKLKKMHTETPKPPSYIYAAALLKAMKLESRGETLKQFKTAALPGTSIRTLFP